MIFDLMYIELKTGFNNDGPAWIGRVTGSKTGKTLYFNGHALQRSNGIAGNYHDTETGEEYWISGLKKDGSNRHRAGHGKIFIERVAVDEYLSLTGLKKLKPSQYELVDKTIRPTV